MSARCRGTPRILMSLITASSCAGALLLFISRMFDFEDGTCFATHSAFLAQVFTVLHASPMDSLSVGGDVPSCSLSTAIRALHLTLLLVALREKRSSSTLPCLCDCHGGGSFVIFTTNFKIKIEQLNNVWKSPAVPSENLSSRHIASFFRFGGLESVLFCELCAPPTMKWYAGILCAAFWVSQRTFRR